MERELRVPFKLGKNPKEIDRLLFHIDYCTGEFGYSLRRGKGLYYYKKQIEVAKRKLKPFRKELHPIERRSINL